MSTDDGARRRTSPLFTAVMLLLAAYLLFLSVPNVPFVIRAARADGTPGVFTAQRLSCVRHPGHESCSWVGEFRSRDGRVRRTQVSLHGGGRGSLRSGAGIAAIDIGRPGQVYGPEGSREWIPTTVLLLGGVTVLGLLAVGRRRDPGSRRPGPPRTAPRPDPEASAGSSGTGESIGGSSSGVSTVGP